MIKNPKVLELFKLFKLLPIDEALELMTAIYEDKETRKVAIQAKAELKAARKAKRIPKQEYKNEKRKKKFKNKIDKL